MTLLRPAISTTRQSRLRRAVANTSRPIVLGAMFVAVCSIIACSMTMPWSKSGGGTAAERIETPMGPGGPTVRVRIERSIAEASIGARGEVHVTPRSASGATSTPLTFSPPVRISRGEAAWDLAGHSGRRATLPDRECPGGLDIASQSATDPLTLDRVPYAGTLRVIARPDVSGGAFDVVEHVDMETYLPGVLAKELVADWSLETFKAQAIAARSYAIHEIERKAGSGLTFDVESTTRSQAYGGLAMNPTARRAVSETRGEILTWRGEVLRAYYSSTSGGRQARARDIWPTGPGWEFNLATPINSPVEEPYSRTSPVHRWQAERELRTFTQQLNRYGKEHGLALKDMSEPVSIEPARRNPLGRPIAYTVRDDKGKTIEVNAEHMRMACNHPSPVAIEKKQRVMSGDCEFDFVGPRVIIRGRGFGHGVGMCQWGAEGRARAGQTAEQILTHYYPGALINQRY
jgi:stage II sporulation protein D